MSMYLRIFKRLFDLCASIIGIVLTLPVLLTISILLLIEHKGKVIFIQCRPGEKEKPINVYKFKTMNDKTDLDGNLLPNHARTTRIGRFLRDYSLDELPQLVNVLRGDMSLVGPRPLLFRYIPLYSSDQRRRHDLKPGITGWAQVNGRNAISWSKKFELDLYYIENVSFVMDIKILWMTFVKLVRPQDINSGDNVTMPPFNGTN